jgi:hypothetical protein
MYLFLPILVLILIIIIAARADHERASQIKDQTNALIKAQRDLAEMQMWAAGTWIEPKPVGDTAAIKKSPKPVLRHSTLPKLGK